MSRSALRRSGLESEDSLLRASITSCVNLPSLSLSFPICQMHIVIPAYCQDRECADALQTVHCDANGKYSYLIKEGCTSKAKSQLKRENDKLGSSRRI